ncbi:hypothetical protein HQ36_06015 [Porphyromonas gingivicanis]|uniref:Uncharacterized protein n=1 Tax=Porphyromonas gingivicanis TaxID=266762 RepID=A0A0A2G523_9PORP|nr:hypothetical protein HQ36_06015 [Porphyromonas gingivicanis]
MSNIILELVRLIAVDDEAQAIIERLKGDGIDCIENSSDVLLDVVIATSGKEIDKDSISLPGQVAARKTILLQATDAYKATEHDGFDAILSFSDYKNVYEEIKSFLCMVHDNLEIHGICSFDFYDFCSLVTGRNCISLQTYPYTSTIEQAFSFLKYDSNKGQNKYLLTLYIGYDEEENDKIFRAFPNFQFIDTFPDDTILNFNIIQSALRQVTLMTITPN